MSRLLSHPIAPLYDDASTVLILGTFPSVKSREGMFFYHHPQNRFWRVLSAVYGARTPDSIAEKTAFLHDNHIAVWDVIASCEIQGSSDASIRGVIPTDLSAILRTAPIQTIFCNGTAAWTLYQTHQLPITGRPAVKLPSTSPANARFSLADLTAAWSAALLESQPAPVCAERCISGYCRQLDQPRMVLCEYVLTQPGPQLQHADCAYPDCAFAASCQLAVEFHTSK